MGSRLRRGRAARQAWNLLRDHGDDPLIQRAEDHRGEPLHRDPVGFPGAVRLRDPRGLAGPAGALRLMKAAALAAATSDGADRIDVVVQDGIEPPRAEINRSAGRLHIVVGADFGDSASEVRRAVLGAVRRAAPGEIPVECAGAPTPARAAKVLLLSNPFDRDTPGDDALHVNPGMHHLITPLQRAGCETVLLDSKIPFQDVCADPPPLGVALAPEQIISDRAELDRALDDHPDLDLVCLTLLERCFDQVQQLCRYIRQRSGAFIAVGGAFPTATPEHAFAHLPEADLVVRGEGDEVVVELARLVAGCDARVGLDEGRVVALLGLDGVLARVGTTSVSAHSDRINRAADLDACDLDFRFFAERNVEHGLSLSTSRGCVYSCRFCSVPDRQLWRAKSAEAVMADLDAYDARLLEIYGAPECVPPGARDLQIWDDDFFLDRPRAIELLQAMAERRNTLSFVQGTVASFFARRPGATPELDLELLDAISPALFTERGGLKIGTENFCDRELRRLGKPYRYAQIRELVIALGERELRQDHYLILVNTHTSLDDLLQNLERITELRWLAGIGFNVLQPSWLSHLFPTAQYRTRQRLGEENGLPTQGTLADPGFPELDYPFVLPERPVRREVYEVAARIPAGMHFGAAEPMEDMYTGVFEADDPDYLKIYPLVEATLRRRLAEVEGVDEPGAIAEVVRVRAALQGHLGAMRSVPAGLLARFAPGLATAAPPSRAPLGDLVRSLATALVRRTSLAATCGETADETTLVVGDGEARIRFRVDRYEDGQPCAFHTRNLAFTVASPADGEAPHPDAETFDAVCAEMTALDVHPLR
jgi:hypothetical protein